LLLLLLLLLLSADVADGLTVMTAAGGGGGRCTRSTINDRKWSTHKRKYQKKKGHKKRVDHFANRFASGSFRFACVFFSIFFFVLSICN